MFVVIREDKSGKLKVISALLPDGGIGIAEAKSAAFKGEEGDSFYVCEVQAKVIPKIMVEQITPPIPIPNATKT